MNWFFIALITPVTAAFVNHFDKYLVSRFTKDSSVGVLILFSSLFAVVALPVILVINPDVFSTASFLRSLVLMINGGLLMLAILFYLYALENHEASYIAPMFELIPVFSFFLGFIFLGETLVAKQFIAAGLIILGSIILAVELEGRRSKVKINLILLMSGASLLYALNAVVFKYVSIDQSFTASLFWDMLGKVFFGLLLFVGVKSFRRDFLHLVKSHHYYVIGLNVINEIIGLIGMIAVIYAVLLAPVVLVQVVGSLQTGLVFIFGILITLFFPKFGQESLLFKHLAQKVTGIVIVTIGIYLLELF